ncbi:calcium-binding protein [Streptomyces sp. enrichment culture]|uniref:calcium-binding protein n=1 Tax=Streptomyces sp. enrichment culture TaxID=1795815 RepID=UPI003F56F016
MRMRATLGVVTGALALSAVAVPAAQADVSEGDTTITKVAVNTVNKVYVGTSAVKFKVAVTATDDSGILDAEEFDLYGPNYGLLTTSKPTCTAVSATTSTCVGWVTADPRAADVFNNNAGTWTVDVWINAKDEDYIYKENAGSFKLLRKTALSTNAAPEPVRKGKTVTVTGKLTRANWETYVYNGYGYQYVKLQYKKKGATSYTTLKTVKAASTGALKAYTTATYDGYYRFSYVGNGASAPVNSAADYIDVQ